jgi:light-harvesting protein B-800-850 alpha chain
MNEGKIWTVVKPSTGVPLFLGTIVVMVFTVHYAILSHTTWFASYWQGNARASVAAAPAVETAPAAATPTSAAPVTPAP